MRSILLCAIVALFLGLLSATADAAPRRPVLRAAAAVLRLPRVIRERRPVRRLVGRAIVQPIRRVCTHCR